MAEQRRETSPRRKRAEVPVSVELSGQDVDHMASAMHRSTSDHMAPAILRSLHGTGQDVNHVALANMSVDVRPYDFCHTLVSQVLTGPGGT